MHKVNITSGLNPVTTKIMLDDQTFEGVRALDVRMRVDEAFSITAEILPELVNLEYQAADVFIIIGNKKYRLMECVGESFDLAKDGFWVGETVLIDAADYKGNGKLIEQAGKDLFHVELEGKDGTYLYRRHEIKKIVGEE